jgi:CRISPR-associated protein Cas1
MAFRNIIVRNPAYISVRHSQLIIRTEAEHSLPLEDISALLIEDSKSTITTAALSLLGQSGCAVFICNNKHMPCAVLTPFSTHSRSPGVLRKQINMSPVLQKKLWQSIIMAKIKNQAKCLQFCGKAETAEGLFKIAESVKSGDAANSEAMAARRYFPALFGDNFYRRCDNGINSGLNYGYAIIRGSIARNLAVCGFQPELGIHHNSELNAFNLADDFIEPFRPLIDMLVFVCFDMDSTLDSSKKNQLFNSLNLEILSGEQHHSTSYAIERMIHSFKNSLDSGANKLLLPELLELKQHCYE